MKKSIMALILIIAMLSSTCTAMAMFAAKDGYKEGENILTNGGYEIIGDDGYPVDVNVRNGWGTLPFFEVQSDQVHSGNNALKIDCTDGKTNAYTNFEVNNLVGGAKYRFSFWYKGEILQGSHIGTQIEEYSNGVITQETQVLLTGGPKAMTSSKWTEYVTEFELVPTGNTLHLVTAIWGGKGTAYFDDFELVMIQAPEQFEFDPKAFFYTDWETVTTEITMHDYYEDENYTVKFELKDGNKILKTAESKMQDKRATFELDLKLLAEKKKAYTLNAIVLDKKGNELKQLSKEVYRYDRPTNVTKDGQFLDENGEIFYPVLATASLPREIWPEAAERGINVVGWTYKGAGEQTKEELDYLHSLGMKAMVVCYWEMYPAGNARNLERVAASIKDIKDHPAVFAYNIMDEPFAHNSNAGPELRAGYKMIRDIDDVHPTAIVESVADKYVESGNSCDLMVIDPYPGNGYDYATHVADMSLKTVEGINYEKPVLNYLQAWDWVQPISALQFHSTIHQALLGGSQALGYFGLNGNPPHQYFYEDEIWQVMTDFRNLEYDIMMPHFTKGQARDIFNGAKNEDAWYEVWVDGDALYFSVQNRTHENNTITVPLKSKNGKVVVDDYELTLVSNVEIAGMTKNSGSCDITLIPEQAALFKVTPAKALDLSLMNAYGDMDNYAWALDAVTRLDEEKIIEFGEDLMYRPGEKITRGDFAKMLIRTIGANIEVTAKDNFADVDENADYAKEVAMGKKLGILKGTGDNMFNPEAEISRQDLMVICFRGMNAIRYPETTNNIGIDGFSDKGMIADYALESITTMVNLEIVKGNADGTINPLGNTTRAEAAVIMSRILDWK